ncbi:MAG: hypothetical protein CSA33_02985 [Desulfobulbus propionicus]|nr:MAG: hypothetical protein CSA33_02985 [Desulfobulbus propionicus]
MTTSQHELDIFLDQWQESEKGTKKAFVQLRNYLEQMKKVAVQFHARPGITYSLRGVLASDPENSLFVMVDVIEDVPKWLSVCFYGAMITDPDGKGDFVPAGLLGEDAVCFDIEVYDEQELAYVEQRMAEAYNARA